MFFPDGKPDWVVNYPRIVSRFTPGFQWINPTYPTGLYNWAYIPLTGMSHQVQCEAPKRDGNVGQQIRPSN